MTTIFPDKVFPNKLAFQQGVSQKIKTADIFSKLGAVFTKGCHHGWQQEKRFWYNL